MKSKGFLLDLFIVWDNHSKMKWITQHHVLTETKLQPAKVSFLFIWSYFTNGMQFPEQAYLDENTVSPQISCTALWLQNHKPSYCAEKQNKPAPCTPGQEFSKKRTPSQSKRGYLWAEEISLPKQKMGQQYGLINSYSEQESLANTEKQLGF